MRTEYLYEFIKLTEIGNFQTAADALFITQSTLTKHIQYIENELGFPLLEHNKNKFALTSAGMQFLPYATKICDLRTEYTEMFKNLGNTQVIDIGTCHFTSVEDDLFSNALSRTAKEFPDCQFRTPPIMATTNIEEILTDSEHAKLSCLISKALSTDTYKVKSSLVTCETIFEWQLCVLTRKDHTLAGSQATLEDISKEQLISLAYPTFANALAVKAFRGAGLIPIFSNTVNSFRSICDLVSNNKGVFLVTESINKTLLPDDLCLTPVYPAIYSETFVAYSPQFNADYQKRFIEILIDEFKNYDK